MDPQEGNTTDASTSGTVLTKRLRIAQRDAFGIEPMIRGTGCVNRARPDLWEPWAGNRPGPPGLVIQLSVTLDSHGRLRLGTYRGGVLVRGGQRVGPADPTERNGDVRRCRVC